MAQIQNPQLPQSPQKRFQQKPAPVQVPKVEAPKVKVPDAAPKRRKGKP